MNASFFGEFQVVDLQIFAAPRITLKPLVPSFPCFAKIQVSLMEKVCAPVRLITSFVLMVTLVLEECMHVEELLFHSNEALTF